MSGRVERDPPKQLSADDARLVIRHLSFFELAAQRAVLKLLEDQKIPDDGLVNLIGLKLEHMRDSRPILSDWDWEQLERIQDKKTKRLLRRLFQEVAEGLGQNGQNSGKAAA